MYALCQIPMGGFGAETEEVFYLFMVRRHHLTHFKWISPPVEVTASGAKFSR